MRFPFRVAQFLLKRSLLICLVIVVPYVVISSIRPFHLSKSNKGEEDELFDRVVDGAAQRGLKADAQFNRSSGANYDGDVDDMMRFRPAVKLPEEILNRPRNSSLRDSQGDSEIDGDQSDTISLLQKTESTGYSPSVIISSSKSVAQQRISGGQLPLCPDPPPNLKGKMKQDVLLVPTLKESHIVAAHPELRPGGHWKPPDCLARHRVAIIIPFRDRQSHLNRLIEFLIPMLERQQLDFRFIVTEQYGHDLFNKGRIMNAAFVLAEKLGVDCVVFHDVDLFPQDDQCLYWCPDQPLHLGAYVNTLGYELWYNYLAGGVLSMRMEHYRLVNGYSNEFWAWGGEDDDMGYRILAQNLTIERPHKIHGRFTMLKHIKRQRMAPKMIYKLLKTSSTRWPEDGLNNATWNVLKVIKKPLYFHMFVDVGQPPKEWKDGG